MDKDTVRQPKISATCDECKSRKVRCVRALSSDVPICISCKNRGVPCRFSFNKRRAKRAKPVPPVNSNGTLSAGVTHPVIHRYKTPSRNIADERPLPPSSSKIPASIEATGIPVQLGQPEPHPGPLYVDRLLADRGTTARRRNDNSMLKAHEQYVGSSGIAFFSDRRIASISDRLGHRKFLDLMEMLNISSQSRMNSHSGLSANIAKSTSPTASIQLSNEICKLYIAVYFNSVHPIYPFIDRQWFEEKAFHEQRDRLFQGNPAFSALYHTVLALGSQYHGGGSFEPGTGAAWKLYQSALKLLPDILIPKEALVNVQAVAAMAIFAHKSSYTQLGHMLTGEAARMAQSLGLNKAISEKENVAWCHQTFWVIYILEKTRSFACSRASIINDSEIGAPIPEVPEATFGSFDWFHTMCCFSRLLSKMYETLFSISATLAAPSTVQATFRAFCVELECWRRAIPEGFRPGAPFQPSGFLDDLSIAITVMIHYHYYSALIALARLNLNFPEEERSSKEMLLNSSRIIIELTRYVELETFTPVWVLLSVPLSALFVLFDFVVHNPTHPETKSNLSLLGVAAGYFCRLEYISGGALPGSVLSNIANFARDYVRDVDGGTGLGMTGSIVANSSSDHPSEVRTEPPIQGDSTLQPEMLTGSADTEDFFNPLGNVSFPMENRFSDGIDLMDLFATDFPQGLSAFD